MSVSLYKLSTVALFGLKKWSLITQFSSPITHHLKHLTLFDTITHLSLLNIFQLFVGPIPVPCAAFTFLSFFPLQPPVPKLTEPSEKKKKKKRGRTEDRTSEKKKRKKKKTEPRRRKELKKKSQRSKGVAVGPSMCV